MNLQYKYKREMASDEAVNEQEVVAFLQGHPRFFIENPQLLEDIHVKHHLSGASSLIEKQVGVMREQNRYLKNQLQDLVKIARSNGELNSRVQSLALSLIGLTTLEQVCETLVTVLENDFAIDGVSIRLYKTGCYRGSRSVKFVDPESHELDIFGRVMGERRPLCGYVPPSQLDYLFATKASAIQSTVLLPLRGERSIGLLALGSKDGQRFTPDAATDFLEKIGELASRALHTHL